MFFTESDEVQLFVLASAFRQAPPLALRTQRVVQALSEIAEADRSKAERVVLPFEFRQQIVGLG
jgi:hypothetical protein